MSQHPEHQRTIEPQLITHWDTWELWMRVDMHTQWIRINPVINQTGVTQMNASEKREVLKLYTYLCMGERDIVARSLCTLIRSARTERSIIALRAQAAVLEVDTHPDYLDLMAAMGV